MSNFKEVVIVAAKRTPVGSFQGSLSNVPAPKLGSAVIKSIVNDNTFLSASGPIYNLNKLRLCKK
jgi:acetyl-CoA acetyltransferase